MYFFKFKKNCIHPTTSDWVARWANENYISRQSKNNDFTTCLWAQQHTGVDAHHGREIKRHFFSKANKKRLWTYVLAKKLSERTIIRSPLLFGFYQMYGSDRINGHEMPQLDRLLPRSSSPFPSRVPAPRCSLL